MDLQTESVYKDEMVKDPRRFMPLFSENYSGLYRFVARRIDDENTREQIVRLVVLDAIGQMTTSPKDVNFSTWLYKLAGERISSYAKKGIGGMSGEIQSPIFDASGINEGIYDDEYKLKQQAEAYFAILTYEEKEIVRLKFFEELTDGEVMYVMGFSAGSVGKKIYQVLKRSYEILFGKVDEYAGVYYGELYSFLSRLKSIEKIPVPEVFKLKLKAEVLNKLEKMYSEQFGHTGAEKTNSENVGFEESTSGRANVGSTDPAKAFVYAAKGMSKEEVETITKEYVADREAGKKSSYVGVADNWKNPEDVWAEKFGGEKVAVAQVAVEQQVESVENIPVTYQSNDEYADEIYDTFVDKFYNFWEKWKVVFQVIFTGFIAFSVVLMTVIWLTEKPVIIDTGVRFQVNYKDGFSLDTDDQQERISIEKNLIAKIAEGRKISSADISKEDGSLRVLLEDVDDTIFDYVFDIKNGNVFRVRSFKEISN